MTLKELCSFGASALLRADCEDSAYDACMLLCTVAGMSRTQYLLNAGTEADKELVLQYEEMIGRRGRGEPLQYIIGKWSFLDCEFAVGPGVLIPRPETEQLAELCIEKIRRDHLSVVFDLCAGSGCIGISIAKACPDCRVYLYEKYDAAARYCRENIVLNDVSNAVLIQSDIFAGIPEGFPAADLIVSNPPYIPAGEIDGLQREVGFEPRTALDGGEKGLDFYTVIAEKWIGASAGLRFCAVECGEGQAARIAADFSRFGTVRIHKDIYCADRFVCMSRDE